MINGKTVFALIPARGGSKGLPRKNLVLAGGKPLIAWSIEAAKQSKYVDRVILSSDDDEIISIAKKFGCDVPFVRPPELADDFASSYDVCVHAIETIDEEFDILVMLQPTSPLRISEDIDQCVEFCLITGSSISLVKVDKSIHWMYNLTEKKDAMRVVFPSEKAVLRRQDSPPVYVLNGAVYAVDCKWLKKNGSFIGDTTVPYIMPKKRSLDIDTLEDLALFEIFNKMLAID